MLFTNLKNKIKEKTIDPNVGEFPDKMRNERSLGEI